MNGSDLDAEIDELMAEIEEQIQETEDFIDGLPTFPPRSDRARKLEGVLNANG